MKKLILLTILVTLQACSLDDTVVKNKQSIKEQKANKVDSKSVSKQQTNRQETFNTKNLLGIDSSSDKVDSIITDKFNIDVASHPSQYDKKFLAQLYIKGDLEKNNPVAIITNKEPISINKVDATIDEKKTSVNLFSNNFDIYFINKDAYKKLNVNFKDLESLHVKAIYADDNIAVLHYELKGRGMDPDEYYWRSCIELYHKESNESIALYPEGCVGQDVKRHGVTQKNSYERDEVYVNRVEEQNGVYTINFGNIPRLMNSKLDTRNEKVLTYKYKTSLDIEDGQLQKIGCDYRYKQTDQPITEFSECNYYIDG